MTAIWRHDGTGWVLLPPVGFPDEATLHALIEQAPQLLPLAGCPSLVIVGREVQLGSGWADLVALEPSGRVVLIEIKLGHNAEARCAVVAQVFTYAASLYAMDAAFGRKVLWRHLRDHGHDTLASTTASVDQTGAFDPGRSPPAWKTVSPRADSASSSFLMWPPRHASSLSAI